MDSGIPVILEYNRLLESELFKDMEVFSERFLKVHDHCLSAYKLRWVADPLHQWGRQWEYPFVFSELERHVSEKTLKSPALLDAGSGATFFTYYCADKIQGSKVSCCDYDANLESVFKKFNKIENKVVDFSKSDIRKLPYENNSFDILYCISVLEHTKDYSLVLDEFKRVLRPGGLFIITFDISLDGFTDIPVEIAKKLISEIEKKFLVKGVSGIEKLNARLDEEDQLLTTEYIRKVDPGLLPWKYPALSAIKSSLLKGKLPRKLFKNVTCFCMSAVKKYEG